jgi:hypothetical protein
MRTFHRIVEDPTILDRSSLVYPPVQGQELIFVSRGPSELDLYNLGEVQKVRCIDGVVYNYLVTTDVTCSLFEQGFVPSQEIGFLLAIRA